MFWKELVYSYLKQADLLSFTVLFYPILIFVPWHGISTSKMERIQERALRFIYNEYQCSYEDLLHRANLPTLEIKRMRTMAIECFKIIHDLSPNCLSDLVTIKNSPYSFRYSNILDVPRVRTSTYGKKSFKYASAVLWNELPENFRSESNFTHFKSLMSSWNGKACGCTACSV